MKYWVLIFLFPVSIVNASLIKGNGGNTVVCPQSVELLDVYEAKALEENSFAASGLEDRALRRASHVIPTRAWEKMKPWFQSWSDEVQWLQNVELGEVTDSFHFVVPENCKIEQTVLARDPLPGEMRYIVRKDLWDRMLAWQQDALKWHEVFYRHLIAVRLEKGISSELVYNSEAARKMVAALFADESDALTAEQWTFIFGEFTDVRFH
jgi:hypothetical protein